MARRFVFPEPRQVLLEQFELPPLGPADVRVRMTHSLMSTGTENTAFNGIFEPTSHWGDYVQYPFLPGYSQTGVIEELGPAVPDRSIGEPVFLMWPHASEHVLPAVSAFPLPSGIDPVAANWAALAGVAYVGIRRARIQVGHSVVVIGAGPVGQMTTRWASISGSGKVIVVDPAAHRLALASAGGASHVIASPVAEAVDAIRAANNGRRADIVIDTTGRAASFAEGLALVANFGRMIIVGDAGDPTQQHLTRDVIERGIEIAAAHGNYMPFVMGLSTIESRETADLADLLQTRVLGWRAFSALFFDLVKQGRFPLDSLISHSFPADQAAEAFALVNTRRSETMGIAFTWP